MDMITYLQKKLNRFLSILHSFGSIIFFFLKLSLNIFHFSQIVNFSQVDIIISVS